VLLAVNEGNSGQDTIRKLPNPSGRVIFRVILVEVGTLDTPSNAPQQDLSQRNAHQIRVHESFANIHRPFLQPSKEYGRVLKIRRTYSTRYYFTTDQWSRAAVLVCICPHPGSSLIVVVAAENLPPNRKPFESTYARCAATDNHVT
jgi:hypothetical protein